MSFANPLLLLGLLGAMVPVLIHLIHKRRPRKQPFPAIELLMRSVDRVERRWRLKRILLLTARVALLTFLAVAAARPLMGGRQATPLAAAGPERLAIVVDTSLSMRARYGNRGSAFSRALTEARNLVDALGPEDQAVIVATNTTPKLLVPRPTASKRALLGALDDLEPGFGAADLSESVSIAAQSLGSLKEPKDTGASDAEDPEARIVVLSDLSPSSFRSAADLTVPGSAKPASVEVIDVLSDVEPQDRSNQAILSVEAASVPGRTARTVEFKARIQSFEKNAEAHPTDITVRGQKGAIVEGSLDVVPGTITDKVMRHAFESVGMIPVEVVLAADTLIEDNVRYLQVDVRHQVQSLVVDGAPSGVPKEDEVFYLERAMQVGAADQPAPRVITVDDLTRADFSAFDVVVLAGVATFGRSDATRLVDFVEKGGGLLISVSEDMDVELYNTELARLLPRPIRGLKITDPEIGGVGSHGIVTLAEPDVEHPVMEIFTGDGLGGLLSTRTRAYFLLQPGGAHPVHTLVEYQDGQPALLEAQVGQGRVALLTTSIDRDMTDLPIRPAFVPLVRRLVLWLGDALTKPDQRRTLVGEPRTIRVPPGAQRLLVRSPDGSDQSWSAASLGGRSEVAFKGTTVPGHYEVLAGFAGSIEPLRGESFAVNVDPRESDLRPLDKDEATSVLVGNVAGGEATTSALARARALSGLTNPETLAGILLLLMLVAYVGESLLTAQRIGR